MPSHTTTVAIVDDDGGIRDGVRTILEDVGYMVVEVASGSAALVVLREAAEGWVVLLDERMPGIPGMAVLDATEFSPALRRHQYLIFTASPRLYTAHELVALAQRGIPIVAKPFDIDELLLLAGDATTRLP